MGKGPRRIVAVEMIADRDIAATAKLVRDEYGETAWLYAAQRAEELLDLGDVDGRAVWKRILAAVEQLQDSTIPVGITRQ